MPWEIDHALLVIDKLKKSQYYINPTHKIYIDTALNLSSAIIDWDNSKLPKEYFIQKYEILCNLLKENFTHTSFIYEGDSVYGHLNLQKSSIDPNIDYYIGICPDINFSEYLLYYLIEASQNIKDDYFILTPQIFKSWDSSWDLLVNSQFMDIPYNQCINFDIHQIEYSTSLIDKSPSLKKLNDFKFAGWFDLYNKKFWEELAPVLEEWNGYGPWDLYSMTISKLAKSMNFNVNQYVLENQIIWFYDTGCLRNYQDYGGDGQLKVLYKNFLTLKLDRHKQRAQIENNMPKYIQSWIDKFK